MVQATIIVPFLNARPYLAECAESLHRQSLSVGEVELIFVDTGSNDGSSGFLEKQFSKFRVLRCPSCNPYAARNLAGSAARGDVLLFTDSDCAVGGDWLAQALAAIREGADLATGPVFPAKGASRLLQAIHAMENKRMQEMCTPGGDPVSYAYSNNLAITAGLFRSLGGFDATRPRGGDSDFLQRALAAKPSLVCAFRPDMCVTHLEMTSLGMWLRKKFLYGRSGTAGKSRPVDPRSLGPQTNSPLFSSALLLALACGRLAYSAGRMLRSNRVRRCLHRPGSGSGTKHQKIRPR